MHIEDEKNQAFLREWNSVPINEKGRLLPLVSPVGKEQDRSAMLAPYALLVFFPLTRVEDGDSAVGLTAAEQRGFAKLRSINNSNLCVHLKHDSKWA